MAKRKNQIKRLDKLFSRLVLERDGKICQKCGEFGDNPHHVEPRRKFSLRWLLKNGLTLCTKHHIPYAHAHPKWFKAWFKETFPERYEAIQELRNVIKIDLDEVEAKLIKGERRWDIDQG